MEIIINVTGGIQDKSDLSGMQCQDKHNLVLAGYYFWKIINYGGPGSKTTNTD